MSALVILLVTALAAVPMLLGIDDSGSAPSSTPVEQEMVDVTRTGSGEISVVRLAGADRFATAAIIALEHASDPERVYLATGEDFPDALAAGAVAGAQDSPVLLTASEILPEVTSSALEKLSPNELVIVGGDAAISAGVAGAAAEAAAAEVRRIAGADRFDTAARLSGEFSVHPEAVYVATGEGFPDALAGGAIAGLERAPLLLADGNTLPTETADAITRLDPERVEVLGGTAAIAHSVVGEIEELTAATVTRHAGADRYATAARLIDARVEHTDGVYLATGENFPDALAGGAAAASAGAPLLLSGGQELTDAAAGTLARLVPSWLTLLGGDSALSDLVLTDIGEDIGPLHHRPNHCGGPSAQRHPHCDNEGETEGGDEEDDGSEQGHRDKDDDSSGRGDDADVDHVLSGDVIEDGFTVPEDEVWAFDSDTDTTVETSGNVVVEGTLRMRPIDESVDHTLRFVDVDESAFQGGGMQVLESDVGLWVVGDGQLDIEGAVKEGWNRTGDHPTWAASDEYVAAPFEKDVRDATSWMPGDDVPCTEFAGKDYCTEIANLTRNVSIEGTPDGKAHIMVMSGQPQTIKYAELRHLAPEVDDDTPDGRYGLHFHHAGDGARGSLIEGVVIRNAGDHAFVPHESHGITFRDTIAYDVTNAAYWWDPGDRSDDVLYERAMVMEADGSRDSGGGMAGFNLGLGEGNACIECVAAGVGAGRASSGFGWIDANSKWEFSYAVAHNNVQGVYHWRNEPSAEEDAHHHTNFLAYHNTHFGVEQGAYVVQAFWDGVTMFGNGREAINNRGAPRAGTLNPGIAYRNGTLSTDWDHTIGLRKMRNCGRDSHILWEDLHLLGWEVSPILIDHDRCAHDDGDFQVVFRHVVVGPERRDLERDDFTIQAMPDGGVITVERTDGDSFTIER